MKALLSAALLVAASFAAEPLRWENRHIDEMRPGCDDAKDGCAHAEFTYLEMVAGPAAARERINAAVRECLLSRPGDDNKWTPEEYARNFVKDDGTGARLRLFKSIKVLRSAPPFFTIEYSDWAFYGGVHGDGSTIYLNFDAETGERLKVASLLREGAVPRLTAIAETHFRQERKLSPTADLADAGFPFFAGNRFTLTGNVGILEDGLLFTYNTYEAGGYAQGPTTFELRFAEIRDVLRPGIVP